MRLSWLHLSDIHFRASSRAQLDARAVLTELMKAVRDELKREPVDFMVVTGDIAFSGKAEEYHLAQEFLGMMQQHARVGRETTFIVPGNHDVDRDCLAATGLALHSAIRADPSQLDKILSDDAEARATLFKKLQAYASFVGRHYPHCAISETKPYYCHRCTSSQGIPVSIVGLTSCLVSQKGEGGDGEERIGSQVLALYQLKQLIAEADDAKRFVVALTHHPMPWLTDGGAAETYLEQYADALLSGHVHDARFLYAPGPARLRVRVAAGSTYAGSQYTNGATVVRLALANKDERYQVRSLQVRGWQWQATALRWGPDLRIGDSSNATGVYTWSGSTHEPASVEPTNGDADRPRRTPRATELTLLPPEVPHAVDRPTLEHKLAAAATASAVVLVEGLAGSGKSTALARYLKTAAPSRVYWYEVVPGETIDGLFSSLGVHVTSESDAPGMRATELLNKIAQDGRVLVVDGYDLGDQRSFSVLLAVSRRLRPPAALFLVSRAFVDALLTFPAAGRVSVPGLATEEIETLLAALGGRHLARYARRLVDVCAGLPLAVTLFAALVKHFGRDPEMLLQGEMMQHDRLRDWFDDVTARIGANAKRLLAMVSVPSRPFTRRLASVLADAAGIAEADRLLDELHRSYLVTSHGVQRSTVHRLLATLAQATLSDEDRRLACRATGQYYHDSVAPPLRRRHTRSEFSTLVAACQSFQAAFETKRADRLIEALAGTAKANGYYEALIALCDTQLQLSRQNMGWVKYHLAHCHLITGNPSTSLRIAESLVLETSVADNNLRIAALRVQAEALIELDLAGQALNTLRNGYHSLKLDSLSRKVVAHTQSVECRALYCDGQYEESLRLSNVLCEQAQQVKDPRAQAIALVRRALALLRLGRGNETVQADLRCAVRLFFTEGDLRGHAWALATLGQLLITTGHELDGLANLKLAFKFCRQSSFYNLDHHRSIAATRSEVKSAAGRELLDAELARLAHIASSYTSGTPLVGWRSEEPLGQDPTLPDSPLCQRD